MKRAYAVAIILVSACGSKSGGGAGGDGGIHDARPGDGTGGDSGPITPDAACGTLTGVIRDFVGVETPGYHGAASPAPTPHPDFEHNPTNGAVSITGLVQEDLGLPARKPQLNTASPDLGAAFITSATTYAQWYADTANVSARVEQAFPLTETPPGSGLFVFDTTRYFPIDSKGWGIEYTGAGTGQPEVDDDNTPRNFHFTTEFHATFAYRGGEKFTFRGDDDVWVFINNKLAIDIGGIHSALGQVVDLDAETATDIDTNGNVLTGTAHVHALNLGIAKGSTYPIDFFQAERHVTGSNFRLETSIQCFTTVIN